MAGKGRKRREKNYRAAHGGFSRLPPPPDRAKSEALPSKLRKLMSFTSPPTQDSGPVKEFKEAKKKRKTEDNAVETISHHDDVDEIAAGNGGIEDLNALTSDFMSDDDDVDTPKSSAVEKRKKKRKRNDVKDLRFEEELKKLEVGSRRREKKKKYLEARKSKKKAKTEEEIDFPGQEKIKFGDIVLAPPKLVVPKGFKTSITPSQERIRLKAIEEYRKRKGWNSRPGIHVPSPVEL